MDFSIIDNQNFTISHKNCKGCENQCNIKAITFASGNRHFSGNQCENIFSNKKDASQKGINLHAEKYKLLFDRVTPLSAAQKKNSIGIPRALGMYENFPFWHTLLTEAGFSVTLSNPSSNTLYESGISTIMSDNICFPAKLMHGHIQDLLQQGVERILYPYIIHEIKEDTSSQKSYNCPIVSGYSDVLKSALDAVTNRHVAFDVPVVSFHDKKLMEKGCWRYLQLLGVKKAVAQRAIETAYQAQNSYLKTIQERALEIAKQSKQLIVLAGRPYHIDPLIQHKIAENAAEMGIDVITENIGCGEIFNQTLHVSQWAYPNRLLKAAHWVASTPQHVQLVQLTSFGCGPDAFILDEVKEILHSFYVRDEYTRSKRGNGTSF